MLQVLKERVARKDELLQGYERDLAKLRQAEKLVEQKHLQVESLAVSLKHLVLCDESITITLTSRVFV